MKTGSRKGAKARSEVRLTVRQAEVLLAGVAIAERICGLTPDERLLVGAARRRVERVKKGSRKGAKAQRV